VKKILHSLTALALVVAMLFSLTACRSRKQEEGGTEIPDIEASASSSDSSSGAGDGQNMPSNSPGSFLDKILEYHNKNNDTIGWLYVPGTDINESVVQSTDNSYYLRRTNLRAVDRYGCYFADYECNFTDGHLPKNTIIYGHSMEMNDDPNGTRFSQLKRWLDPTFAKEHPYIYFSTPEKDMVYKIFTVMYTTTKFNYIDPEPSNTEFLSMLNQSRNSSQYNYPVEVNATDSIITLSTCVYKFTGTWPNNYRYVIMGRLVRPGEETPDTVAIETNPNPKQPQA